MRQPEGRTTFSPHPRRAHLNKAARNGSHYASAHSKALSNPNTRGELPRYGPGSTVYHQKHLFLKVPTVNRYS
jgi:hypothetical protein